MNEKIKDEVKLTNEQKLVQGIVFDEETVDGENKKAEEPKLVNAIEFLDEEPKDSSEMEYAIFYIYADDEGEEIRDWKIIEGRKALYDFIKGAVETMDIDESFILSEKEVLKKRLTVYEFMKYVVKEQNLYPDDNFDIDEYR